MNRFLLGLLLCVVTVAAHAADAFVPPADMDVVEQPDSRKVVATIKAGTSHPVIKRGGPQHTWCKLDVSGQTGWVRCGGGGGPSTSGAGGHEGQDAFSYYVLSLSWSPTFCAQHGSQSPEQCAGERHFGFVVHGLWPQHEKGYPQNCANSAAPTAAQVESMLDLMPSTKLVSHEWTKHGTCSGLSTDAYLKLVREAYGRIHIPRNLVRPEKPVVTTLQEIEQWFVDANPGLTRDQFAVECKGEVSEVRFCLQKDLALRACGSDVRSRCKGSVRFPAVR